MCNQIIMNFVNVVSQWTILTALCLELSKSALLQRTLDEYDNDAVFDRPKVFFVSICGFRYDYLEMAKHKNYNLPNFEWFRNEGVHVPNGVRDVYPTNTIPNHMSMITGLYAENHGYLENNFYDPKLNEYFVYKKDSEKAKFADPTVEPIWLTNQRNGYKSASCAWYSTNVTHNNQRITKYFSCEAGIKYRIDTILNWLAQSDTRTLGLLYYPELDVIGHKYGPNSEEVMQKLMELDQALSYLRSRMQTLRLSKVLNIILTSDHGMTDFDSKTNTVVLDELLDSSLFHYSHNRTYPKPGREEEFYNTLKQKANTKFDVFRRADIPSYLHYSNNPKIPAVYIMEKQAFWVIPRRSFIISKKRDNKGEHGYSPENKEMLPFFIGWGPAFPRNHTLEDLHIVDLFYLICTILGLNKHPHTDGSMERANKVLKGNWNGKNASKLRERTAENYWYKRYCWLLITMSILIALYKFKHRLRGLHCFPSKKESFKHGD